jgi:SAM-dependent methyltransferase
MPEHPATSCPPGASLHEWYHTPPGQRILACERQCLETILPGLFGYHLAAFSAAPDEMCTASRIRHRFRIAPAAGPAGQVRAHGHQLPFGADSLDVCVLHHALEFAESPHQMLREVQQALRSDGHLVLLVFNPWSAYGLWRLLFQHRRQPPWCGRFYSETRVRDWLELLGFVVLDRRRCGFVPPWLSDRAQQRLGWLDYWGARLWPAFGGAYLLLACKQVAGLTPQRPRWRAARGRALGLAQSAPRISGEAVQRQETR